MKTDKQRFLDKISPEPNSGCWLWVAGTTGEYGKFHMIHRRVPRGGHASAHRAAWLLFRGDIPHGLEVRHKCGVRCCANPDHLFLGIEDAQERFWRKVDKPNGENGCWLWTGSFTTPGYGQFRADGKNLSTHRYAYEISRGPIPKGLLVCHHCDNPKCVRPDHLFLGTHKDNHDDSVAKGRRNHLGKGCPL